MLELDTAALMEADLPWFEPPNERRGGWSGVSQIDITFNKQIVSVFVKRQHNYTYRDPRRLFASVPMLRREYESMIKATRLGVPTPEVLAFEEIGKHDCILVTRALTDHVDLSTFLQSETDESLRREVLRCLTANALKIHQARFQHGCLYSKHILVRQNLRQNRHGSPIAILDFEKFRTSSRVMYGAAKDISQLFRRTSGLMASEVESIVSTYETYLPGFKDLLKSVSHGKRAYDDSPQNLNFI